MSFNTFASMDRGASLQRGLEYDENRKATPSGIATAELGPWTRKGSQWTADFKDQAWTFGVGGSIGLVPDRIIVDGTYSVSLGDIVTKYAGYGVTNWDGTPFPPNHQFAFGSVPRINQDLHAFDLRFQFPIVDQVSMVLGYNYERFRVDDWAQGTSFAWVEPVGSEFLLRDTSRSHQWGNRLFNLGSFLAPAFNAHVAYASFKYHF
ncbi:MAG: MtrB/PioB family outer membrane beta-barrel protein [Acidobacteria bacterium]|nr:MtrB/PioB family outer membrane beta-barrel protein [Acidobacteriota bacterium]